MDKPMNDDVTGVFRGFLNLVNLDKLRLVEAINEYFDSNDKEPIRAGTEDAFNRMSSVAVKGQCKCCGTRRGNET